MKKNLKHLLALCLTLALVFSLSACGQKADETPNDAQDDQQTEQEKFTPANYSIAALKGPTAMGLVKLMKDSESGETTGNEYTFTLAGSADEVTPALLKGELDMACVPANLAAVLYNKTEGEIEVLAVNTLGVLYIVENGESVHSMADLKGKTIVAAGKGSTPEYALRYLLTENGIDPDNDVTIDWKSEHSECVAALASGQASVALLPQPFVTVAQSKIEGLRMALDLNAEWDALDNGSALITGVIVARRAVVEENPAAVNEFLKEYAASVDYVNANTADAAALIGEYSIVDAAVAEKALPYCNIVCLTGADLLEALPGYLEVLYNASPAAVGGEMPGAVPPPYFKERRDDHARKKAERASLGSRFLADRLAACRDGTARGIPARRAAAPLSRILARAAHFAGGHGGVLVRHRHVEHAHSGRLFAFLRAGSCAGGAFRAVFARRRAACAARGGGQDRAGGVVHHSGAYLALQPNAAAVHRGADGLPARVLKCA